MDLGYSELQELLRQTARSFAQRDYPVSRHRELVESKQVFDPETWNQLAGLGWLGLLIDERYGGGGATWVDLMVLLEELGRALIPCQLMAQTLAGQVIQQYGTEAQRQALLPALAAGERIFAGAITEAAATFDRGGIQTTAEPAGAGYRLRGSKLFVRGAQAADTLIVLARQGDELSLLLVEKASPGVTVTPQNNIGDDDQAIVQLSDVSLPAEALLGGVTQDWQALDRIVAWGALIECGYSVGMIDRDTEMTIGYVKDRVQFGRPLGTLQAVQHQVADQVTDRDCGRYLTLYAAWSLDEGQERALADIWRAKGWVSDALRRVTRTGNQLHGGIGFSREYDLHFYYQRAKTAELMFGNADLHRELVAAALLGA